jgi:hypothetical protein
MKTPLTSLVSHLARFKARCLAAGWLGAHIHVEGAELHAANLATATGQLGRLAYAAEQSDLQAVEILETVLRDGEVVEAELPLLKRALGHIKASARRDHQITELTA